MSAFINTRLLDPSACERSCHGRGSCFGWGAGSLFENVCACEELWEGRLCGTRQLNPYHPCRGERKEYDAWHAAHGVACSRNTSARNCSECGGREQCAGGSCWWVKGKGGEADECSLKPAWAPFTRACRPYFGRSSAPGAMVGRR